MNGDSGNGAMDPGTGGSASRQLYQELRLALVFNGGVSLAVWMGGVAKEIDRFRCAFTSENSPAASRLGPYRELLDAMRTIVQTDVIAGASAGGINGALLAYVVANGKSLECAGSDRIRDTWQSVGSMDNLLYTSGEPGSILKTNEVLFSGCAQVFSELQGAQADLSDDVSRWVRLTVTATDTHGYQVWAQGLSGERISGPDHRLQMRLRHVVYPSGPALRLSPALRARITAVVAPAAPAPGVWPFPQPESSRDLAGPNAAAFLTRAARTTSSFPIAFAPSELPLNYQAGAVDSGRPGEALTATPPMAQIVEAPAGPNLLEPVTGDANAQIARYAIDGGVWDNSPFSAVLRSVERTPSGRDVRRVLAYVVGTRKPPADDKAVTKPSLAGALLQAIALPADLSFANDLGRIKDDQNQQHGTRVNVLGLLGGEVDAGATTPPPDVFEIARQLFPMYKKTLGLPDTPLGALVSSAVRAAQELPDESAPLAGWWATADHWGWGIQPVRNSVQEARRLLRPLLRKLAAAGAADTVGEGTVDGLIGAREMLSQLTWALDDLTDLLMKGTAAATPDCAAICGQAMNDFGDCVAGLSRGVAAFSAKGLGGAFAPAFAAAATLTSGGPETVIKRALALDIALTTLSSQTSEAVDYGLTAIRPGRMWPDPPSSPPANEDGDRPPLAGATLNHFGGFMRASWRLNDWMWGRIDGNQAIVDLLVTGEHLGRLADPDDPGATAALAQSIAQFVVPDAVDESSYSITRTLALDAFSTHDLPRLADRGPETAEAVNAAPHEQAALVTLWQNQMAGIYARLVPSIAKNTSEPDRLRADIGRRFRFTIIDEELPGIVAASRQEGGSLPQLNKLLEDRNAGLRTITPTALSTRPGLVELLQDGENGVANVLFATRDRRVWLLAASLRELAHVTSGFRATIRALRTARHYARHRKS